MSPYSSPRAHLTGRIGRGTHRRTASLPRSARVPQEIGRQETPPVDALELPAMETAPALDGAALRAARVRAGLSQNELAKLVGLAGGVRVSKWERGEARPRSPHALHAVAKALNVEARELLAPENEPSLRWLRFAAGVSISELALAAHCAVSTVKRWEAQGVHAPSEVLVSTLAAALGTSSARVQSALRT